MSGLAGNLKHEAVRKTQSWLGAELRQRGTYHVGVNPEHVAFACAGESPA